MKIKHSSLLILLVCLACNLTTRAQQISQRVKLKLSDPKTQTAQTYLLNSISYSHSQPYADSLYTKQNPNTCSVNIDFKQNMDPFLLKWVSGEMKEADGVITVEAVDSGKQPRTIAFQGGTAAFTSESYISGDSYLSAQMSIYINKLVIDGVVIYTAPAGKPQQKTATFSRL